MNVLHNRFLDLLITRRFFDLLFDLLLLFVLMVNYEQYSVGKPS